MCDNAARVDTIPATKFTAKLTSNTRSPTRSTAKDAFNNTSSGTADEARHDVSVSTHMIGVCLWLGIVKHDHYQRRYPRR